ncbi:helix-turn-helix transcriptional regulator [Allorhizobium sp. BGMRC 0089]|uniref:ATP-binding protein n=1 Tax=Allorhizobium sonneratiae TaxID=2934936 RepID=UPI0020345019|nr:winged helix-turn-helix domain-containing protein [Allorhizobium sonneratiae]MCM2294627.1 helix-turn-helix transcriptional regulator [Allorhizobium sonneratiae]
MMAKDATGAVVFSSFLLNIEERALFEHGAPVRIGSRALDILIALAERPGELVAKAELLERVWPGQQVDEAALRVHLSTLRRLLGCGRNNRPIILNDNGRGYRLVAPVERPKATASESCTRQVCPFGLSTALPVPVTSIIGREQAIRHLVSVLPERGFVTLTGTGGIGKTRLAVEVAGRLALQRGMKPVFADFSRLADNAGLPMLVGTLLGEAGAASMPALEGGGMEPPGIAAILAGFFAGEPKLLLLDNCEHVAVAAAMLAEHVRRLPMDVPVLATSREPLRAAGEWVHRLPPLDLPERDGPHGENAILASASVRLFLERVRSTVEGFTVPKRQLPVLAEICRQLDGNPLALEMAAARLDMLGLDNLIKGLSDRFHLLTTGLRTALPRQKSLKATIDWSYDLLPQTEQDCLQALSLFPGRFSVEAALAVMGESGNLDQLSALVDKSLVVVDDVCGERHLRLLQSIRAYGLEKLATSGSEQERRKRYAAYFIALFHDLSHQWYGMDMACFLARNGHLIDDVRLVLGWGKEDAAQAKQALTLLFLAAPLYFHLLRLEEYLTSLGMVIKSLNGMESPQILRELPIFAQSTIRYAPGANDDRSLGDSIRKTKAVGQDAVCP